MIIKGREENVEERREGVGRKVMREWLILLRDLERIDREMKIEGIIVEGDEEGVKIMKESEELRKMLVEVKRKIRKEDEDVEVVIEKKEIKEKIGKGGKLEGEEGIIEKLEGRWWLEEIVEGKMIDEERDELIIEIKVEKERIEKLKIVVILDEMLERKVKVEVGEVKNEVKVEVEEDEKEELGIVIELELKEGKERVIMGKGSKRIVEGMIEEERDKEIERIKLEKKELELMSGGKNIERMEIIIGKRNLGKVDEELDERIDLEERKVIGDVSEGEGDIFEDRVIREDKIKRIDIKMINEERDKMGLMVDEDDMKIESMEDGEDLRRMVEEEKWNVGKVKEKVNEEEVEERKVIGDVIEEELKEMKLLKVMEDLRKMLRKDLLKKGKEREKDVEEEIVNIEDLKRLREVNEWGEVEDRKDIEMDERKEGKRKIEVEGEKKIEMIEDEKIEEIEIGKIMIEIEKDLLEEWFLERKERLEKRVLDKIEVKLKLVERIKSEVFEIWEKLIKRKEKLEIKKGVDDRNVILDGEDEEIEEIELRKIMLRKGLWKKGIEIWEGRVGLRNV